MSAPGSPPGLPLAPGPADPRSAPQAPGSGRCPSRCPSRCSPWPGCPWCSTTSRPAPRYGGPGPGGSGPGPGGQGRPPHSAPSRPPQVPGMKEILLMGFYQPHEALSRFLVSAQQEFKIPIRWVGALLPPGYPRWHSPARPLGNSPRAGSSPSQRLGIGLCPSAHGHSRPPALVLPSLPCPGSCPVWFLLQRCHCLLPLCQHPCEPQRRIISPAPACPSLPCCWVVPPDPRFPKPLLFPAWLAGISRSTRRWARVVASITSETRSCRVVLRPSLSSTQTCAQSSPCRRCWSSGSSTGMRTALSFWVPQ